MNRDQFRQNFLAQLDGLDAIKNLLDLLPDVSFFMKDRKGRFVVQNKPSWQYCNVRSESETIGKTDYDFYPRDRADMYAAGDRQVIESGVAIINAIAPAPEAVGSNRLILYSKVPLRDRSGRIIGVAGIHREMDGVRSTPGAYGKMSEAVDHMHTRYAEPISTAQLARMAGVSRSQFDRRFRKLFGSTSRQYLLRIRVNAACRMLSDENLGITEIALECGFYDHSHFSRCFSRLMGISPLNYRKQPRVRG